MCVWHKESIMGPVVVLFPLPLLFYLFTCFVHFDGFCFLFLVRLWLDTRLHVSAAALGIGTFELIGTDLL